MLFDISFKDPYGESTTQLVRCILTEIAADTIPPLDMLLTLKEEEHISLLGGTEYQESGKWSYLAFDPFLIFKNQKNTCWAGAPGQLRQLPGLPFIELRRLLDKFRPVSHVWKPDMPPFTGGAIGYLGYEMLHQIEEIPHTAPDEMGFPNAIFLFHDALFAVDHTTATTWLIANGFGTTHEEASFQANKCLERLRKNLRKIITKSSKKTFSKTKNSTFKSPQTKNILPKRRLKERDLAVHNVIPTVTKEEYLNNIRYAKERIIRGDALEICLTQRFITEFEGRGDFLYQKLLEVNPAPMPAYLRFEDGEILCASPERFLRLGRDGWAETQPIKGTRPRGSTDDEDRALKADLAASKKDLAENIMIVDLARNDLGRICEYGTIHVPRLQAIEQHPFTYQMASTIRGHLRPKIHPVELIIAAFPGGSMTGAPKVAAMKIISTLEPTVRGVFSGSIGWFDFDGAFDLNIVIRTLMKKDSRLSFHTGGAIVADSDPHEEYQETLDKAHGLVRALATARQKKNGSPF